MATDDLPVEEFASAADFETWLAAQHDSAAGIWIRIAKKETGIASVDYSQALDVALCYGWIDGQKRGGETHWLQRFTPRGPASKWSQVNRDKAEKLIAEGRMRPAGQAEIDRAKADGRWAAAYAGARRRPCPRTSGGPSTPTRAPASSSPPSIRVTASRSSTASATPRTPDPRRADRQIRRHAARPAEDLPLIRSRPARGREREARVDIARESPFSIDVTARPLVSYAMAHNGVSCSTAWSSTAADRKPVRACCTLNRGRERVAERAVHPSGRSIRFRATRSSPICRYCSTRPPCCRWRNSVPARSTRDWRSMARRAPNRESGSGCSPRSSGWPNRSRSAWNCSPRTSCPTIRRSPR